VKRLQQPEDSGRKLATAGCPETLRGQVYEELRIVIGLAAA
jgi:hypothetical protein